MLDYHARYYDPAIGRFISPDSVIPDYANPQDLNRYSYVRGNPVRFADPSGHCAENGDESCWSMYETLMNICPECQIIATLQGDIDAQKANYAQLRAAYLNKQKANTGYRDPIFDFADNLSAATPDADVIGINVGVSGDNIQGPTGGVDFLFPDIYQVLFIDPIDTDDDSLIPAIYTYDGNAVGLNLGPGSINFYGGYVWNIPDNVSYEGSFESLTVTLAIGEGAVFTIFRAPNGTYAGRRPWGVAAGPALGAEASIVYAQTSYKRQF